MTYTLRFSGGFKYVVSADKGFVHSEAHAAFVSQKKNHFQVTVTAYGFGAPKFIRTEVSTADNIRADNIRLMTLLLKLRIKIHVLGRGY